MSLLHGELERQVIGIDIVDAIIGLGVGYTILPIMVALMLAVPLPTLVTES